MPTTAVAPSTRTHSWSLVYLSVMRVSPYAVVSAAVIAMGDEGQRHHASGPRRAAHHQRDRRADRRLRARHIAHGDRPVDAGTEAAAGDAPDGGAVLVEDLGAFARGRAAFGLQAHTLARGALAELAQDHLRAGEAAAFAPALAQGEAEIGL